MKNDMEKAMDNDMDGLVQVFGGCWLPHPLDQGPCDYHMTFTRSLIGS